MERLKWEEDREKREKESLKEHARLHKLFVEDRLSFEREKKRMIDEIINNAEDEEHRNGLRALQESWDKRMRGAGSKHNRLVLAQTIFWDHFYEKWYPSIQEFNFILNGKSDCEKS